MNSKPVIVSVVIIGTILAIAGGLGYFKYRQITEGMKEGMNRPEMSTTVSLIKAETGPFQRTATAVGTVQARRHITVASEVAGTVVEVGFESGRVVEEGAVLLRLDASTEEADMRAAEAQRDLARVTLERVTQAAGANAVSKQEIDRARAELDSSAARVEQFRSMIRKKTIVAPFPGRVGLRNVHPGQYVDQGEMVTTLQGIDEMVYVDFSLPQLQAAGLSVGSSVEVAVGGQRLAATVTALESQIDQATRNTRVRATVSSLEGRLKPGAFVDVFVPLGEPATVVLVPTTALRRAPFGDYVFLVQADEKGALRAKQRFVKAAGAAQGRVIITEGLEPGDTLAGDGSFKLREGALVVEAGATAPPAGAAQ
jgi:membrane fusion protein (multidrug efflux system)